MCEAPRWQMANPGRHGGPEIPWAGQRFWQMFTALNKARGSAGFGPLPISYMEVEAYSRLAREPVRPVRIDDAACTRRGLSGGCCATLDRRSGAGGKRTPDDACAI